MSCERAWPNRVRNRAQAGSVWLARRSVLVPISAPNATSAYGVVPTFGFVHGWRTSSLMPFIGTSDTKALHPDLANLDDFTLGRTDNG